MERGMVMGTTFEGELVNTVLECQIPAFCSLKVQAVFANFQGAYSIEIF
jgi:hypothetical protein